MRLPTRSDRFNFTETLKAEIQNKSMRYNNDPVNEEVKDPQVETPAPVEETPAVATPEVAEEVTLEVFDCYSRQHGTLTPFSAIDKSRIEGHLRFP